MQVDYTGRQIEITPALKKFTEKHLKKIRKILGEAIEVSVILTVEKHRHITEINLKSRHFKFIGTEVTSDMYISITAVLEKIERQALRQKEKFIAQKRKSGETPRTKPVAIPVEVVEEEAPAPRIIRTDPSALKPLTADAAAEELRRATSGFLIFRNAESDRISILYRRKDGNLGLLEP